MPVATGKYGTRPRFSTLAVLALTISPVWATTISVTTTADVVGADGKCSLREAISNVNAHSVTVAGAGECAAGDTIADTIVLAAGTYTLAITGAGEDNNASGDLDIRANVAIQGAGMDATIIDANHLDRAFEINVANLVVSMQDLSIVNGRLNAHRGALDSVDAAVDGGAIFVQNATLGLLRVKLDSNQAGLGSLTDETSNDGGDGGAIFSTDTALNIVDCLLTNNHAGDGEIVSGGDGPGGNGGAINVLGGKITIQNSTFSGNQSGDGSSSVEQAGGGGALYVQIAGLSIDSSVFDSNSTGSGASGGGYGGAMQLQLFNDQGPISNTSITRNSADTGGGLVVLGGTTGIINSTISDNQAATRAGAMYADGAILQLDFDTFTANTAPAATGIYLLNTHHATDTAQINLRNTIVAHNTGGGNGCALGDAFSSFISQGHNIAGGGCPSSAVGDIATTNPMLGPLNDNGGIGLTHMPLPISPATDAGSCTASSINEDQRGHSRPIDVPRVANAADGCDIGAVELDDDVFWNGFDG